MQDYNYFRDYYKIIVIDLSKQQALDSDPKAKQQFKFLGKLDQVAMQQCFTLLKKQKKLFQIHKEL